MNRVSLIGFVSNIDSPKEGDKFLRFSMAVKKPTNQATPTDNAYFFNCVVFGKTAEMFLKYVEKGHKLGVGGKLQYKVWEKDGVKKTFYNIAVNELTFIGKTSKNEGQENERYPQRNY